MLEHLRARIVQHEIDHLNGILFTDKLAQDNKKFL
jgi:peptide deformylase